MGRPYEYHLHRSADNGEYYWHLNAGNGETVAFSSETYTSLGGALGGLYRFRQHASDAPINDRFESNDGRIADEEFEVYPEESADGDPRWRFQAGNNQILATGGEDYNSKSAIFDAIERVREQASDAEVVDRSEEPVDVEECSKEGHRPPRSKRYRIRIDREHHVVSEESMTGRELLKLAGKSPVNRYRIDQKLRGGETKKIGLDEEVSFCVPGLERFLTLPLDQREGSPATATASVPESAKDTPRCQFNLPAEDREHLEARGLPWETLLEGRKQWFLVHDFPVPEGYNHETVSVALLLPSSYPTAEINMAYFSPALMRTDGKPIRQTQATMQIDGKSWQRWSRHRTRANPWRPGVDGVATHLGLVEDWLEREFRS